MGQVDSKIAVVTGGASGIGAACAETLAREGAKVVLTDIDDARGQELAAGIRSAGREALYLSLDVTDETRWEQIVVECVPASARPAFRCSNDEAAVMSQLPAVT